MSKEAPTILDIPATSTFVECVFCKTGSIMRPHRRSEADKIAEDYKENIRFVRALDTIIQYKITEIILKFIIQNNRIN